MRTNEELQKYADEVNDDAELCRMIEKVISGNEKLRPRVEAACDQIDQDLRKYAE